MRPYWQQTRAPRYSLLFALPLFLLYQALVLTQPPSASGLEWRNGADVILQQLFVTVAGARGPLIFLILLTGVGLVLVVRDLRSHPGPLTPWFFGAMLVEATALAAATGLIVGSLASRLVHPAAMVPLQGTIEHLPAATKLMLALGAGLYEELLFRVVLVGLLAAGARAALGWTANAAAGFAVITGALIFSAFHYIGPQGDALRLYSFVFRTLAGLFFSALYVTRGFGITAWTHALYDIFVLL